LYLYALIGIYSTICCSVCVYLNQPNNYKGARNMFKIIATNS